MMLGKPEDVRNNVMRNLADAVDSPCGYLLATGCDIPPGAPKENVVAFMDVAREFGPVRMGQGKC